MSIIIKKSSTPPAEGSLPEADSPTASVQSIAESKSVPVKSFTGSGELKAILAQIEKEKGSKVVVPGSAIPMPPRIPTGVFEFDLYTGGGFPRSRYSIVYGPESSGKCHAKGDRILMYDGTSRAVEDIKVGDFLMGPDSAPREVLKTGKGFGPLFKITPVKGGGGFTVNGDHQLHLVCTHDQGNRYKGQRVQISVNEYLSKSNDWKIYHHLYRVGVDFTAKHLPVDPYFLGLWLGDGSSTNMQVYSDSEEIIDWLQSHADYLGGRLSVYDKNSACPGYAIVDTHYRSEMQEMNLFGNKHIPHKYLTSSRSQRLELLAGLIDTDGAKGGGSSCVFYNSNQQLCNQVQWLARSLGYYASVSKKRTTCNGERFDSWQVYISMDSPAELPLRLEYKRPGPRTGQGSCLTSRFTVEPVGDGEFFGFEVDEDHLYMTDEFIVNHNTNICYCAAAQAQRLPPPCNRVVWVDLEGTFDPSWAAQFGIDVEQLIVVKPAYGEEAVDLIDALVRAEDVALLVVDSIATVVAAKEIEGTVEKADVGTSSILVKRLCNKLVIALASEARRGHEPAVILINQTRFKIGVMFGDPECLHGDTLVNFVDGRSVPIRTVVEKKLEGPVWAFNEASQKFVPRKILSHHYNGEAKDGEFLTITSRAEDTKNGVLSATVSVTHKFLTTEGWKEARQLKAGDQLISRYKSVLNGTLLDFLEGAACGDLTLAPVNGNQRACLKLEDSLEPEYAEWKARLLAPHFDIKTYPNDSNSERYTSSPRADLARLRERFLHRNPLAFLRRFTWLGMAVWVMDNGHKDDRDRYTLSVGRLKADASIRDEVKALLSEQGLHGEWLSNGKNFVFSQESSRVLAKGIEPYVPECMHRKLPAGMGGVGIQSLEAVQEWVACEVEVLSVAPASPRKYRDRRYFDIHVEGDNNYSIGNMDNGFVVHNTMPGGQTMKFLSSLTIRLYGKNKIDKTINPDIPSFKETKAVIKKAKIGVLKYNFEYDLCMMANNGMVVGETKSWGLVSSHLKDMGVLAKATKGTGWTLLGQQFPTLVMIQDQYESDDDFKMKLQGIVIDAYKGKTMLVEAEGAAKN